MSPFRAGVRRDGSLATGSCIVNGYRNLTMRHDHPLATRDGVVPEHRQVLYDKIGPGEHACYLCGKRIAWVADQPIGRIYVDHLDERRLNNVPENLEPSCLNCNWRRSNPNVHRNAKTHCVHRHEYTPENTYINANGYRECIQCRAARKGTKRSSK